MELFVVRYWIIIKTTRHDQLLSEIKCKKTARQWLILLVFHLLVRITLMDTWIASVLVFCHGSCNEDLNTVHAFPINWGGEYTCFRCRGNTHVVRGAACLEALKYYKEKWIILLFWMWINCMWNESLYEYRHILRWRTSDINIWNWLM